MARSDRPRRVAQLRSAASERTKTASVKARAAVMRRAADWIRSQDPKLLGDLAEVGVVRRDWLEGADAPPTDAEPMTVITRALEKLVEKRPSTLSNLGLSTMQVLAAASAGDGGGTSQRLSVVFSDLVGFTTYTEQHGDDAARELLKSYYAMAGRVVRSRDGRIVKRLGDGLLMTFADEACAILAALELVDDSPIDVHVRAGIHTGDVLVDSDDIAGHTVNVASRVGDLAGAGEVLATDQTLAGAHGDDRVQVVEARTAELPGISEPVTLHRLST